MDKLFDLGCVDKSFEGYSISKTFAIFNSKSGSRASRSFFSKNRGHICSWPQLREMLLARKDFNDFLANTNQESSMSNYIAKNQFIIAIISDSGIPQFAQAPKVHETESEAKAEAARLAAAHPGKKFACFKCTGIVVAAGVTWS